MPIFHPFLEQDVRKELQNNTSEQEVRVVVFLFFLRVIYSSWKNVLYHISNTEKNVEK